MNSFFDFNFYYRCFDRFKINNFRATDDKGKRWEEP
jgi:hypothetical protein